MALIRLAVTLQDASGKLGNIVFTGSQSGLGIREYVIPANPQTAAQVAQRNRINVSVAYWINTLTDAERELWNDLAAETILVNRLGREFAPSGWNLFAAMYTISLQCTTTITDPAAPPATFLAALIPVSIIHTPATGIIVEQNTDYGDIEANDKVGFFNSTPQSLAIYRFLGPFLFDEALLASAIAAGDTTLVPSAELVINSRYFIRYRGSYINGQITADQILSVDVGATV